jgi:hypothetical protein
MPDERNTKIDFPAIHEVKPSLWAYLAAATIGAGAGALSALFFRRPPRIPPDPPQPTHHRPPFVIEFTMTLVGAYLMGVLSIVSYDHAATFVSALRFARDAFVILPRLR